jgi:hypothetical protein
MKTVVPFDRAKLQMEIKARDRLTYLLDAHAPHLSRALFAASAETEAGGSPGFFCRGLIAAYDQAADALRNGGEAAVIKELKMLANDDFVIVAGIRLAARNGATLSQLLRVLAALLECDGARDCIGALIAAGDTLTIALVHVSVTDAEHMARWCSAARAEWSGGRVFVSTVGDFARVK